MANSYLGIIFAGNIPNNNNFIRFDIRDRDNGAVHGPFIMTYTSSGRIHNYLLPIPQNGGTEDNKLRLVSDYSLYLWLDYGSLGFFQVSAAQVAGEAIITCLDEKYEFVNISSNVTNIGFNLNNNNYQPSTYELVNSTIASYNGDECNRVLLTLETSDETESVLLNNVLITDNNDDNDFSLGITRNLPFRVELKNVSNESLFYPEKQAGIIYSFNISNVNITINNSLIGATIIADVEIGSAVNVLEVEELQLEYSIDDINWQSSNTFTGQPSGTGRIYVRDQFGCKKSAFYEVTDLGTRKPFIFLSKANSVNFRLLEDIDDINVFKNNDNSFDSLNNLNYCFPSLFKKQDKTRIQFKSNFETIKVYLRDELNNITEISTEKKTSNLNSFEKMDCKIYKYKTGKLGIYFESGNTYSQSGEQEGEYELNGNLPDLARIENYVTISDIGTFKITDILLDSNIGKKIIVVDYNYEGLVQDKIIESTYDLLPFEVYEFEIDWSSKNEGLYDLYIENSNSQTINGSRQNLFRYSEDFELASTADENITFNKNVTTAPNGENTATSIIESNADSARKSFYQGSFFSINTNLTWEISAKANGRTKIMLSEVGGDGNEVIFDLINGTSTGGGVHSITDQGNGWWRCKIEFQTTDGSAGFRFQIIGPGDNYIYNGDGVSGLYVWGAQVKDGSDSLDGYIKTEADEIQGSLDQEISNELYLLQSDNIRISNDLPKSLSIIYYNENNRDIFYKYGIKHFIRVEYDYVEAGFIDESEINSGDLSTELVESSLYETDTFRFKDLDDEKMRKLAIALSCENVFINGIGYVKNGNLRPEPVENTNLHDIIAEMIKTNINYNNNTQGQEGLDEGYIKFNIPPFIDADGVFIKL